jgi:large repetitive protein
MNSSHRSHRSSSRLTFLLAALALAFCLLLLVRTGAAWATSQINAQKTVTLLVDVNGNGRANPGDRLRYAVTIANEGAELLPDVSFSDVLDSSTTLVPASLQTTPLALNDVYQAIGNVAIDIPASSGLLANDFGLPAPTVTPYSGNSNNGGELVINADGSFSYNPPVGFKGRDSFTYQVSNGIGMDTATLFIDVAQMVWFINAGAQPGGDGRLSSPYNCIDVQAGCFSINAGLTANSDIIYIYKGDYTVTTGRPLALKSDQKLYGQSVSLAATLGTLPPGSRSLPPVSGMPDITSASGNVIGLAGNTAVEGLILESTYSGGAPLPSLIYGENNLGPSNTLKNIQLTGGSSGYAINLVSATGSLSISGGQITHNSNNGGGVRVSGGSLSLTVDSPLAGTGSGHIVEVSNWAGSTMTLSRAITSSGGGIQLSGISGPIAFTHPVNLTGAGIFINGNNTGTVNFSGGLTAEVISGPALSATNLDSLSVTGNNNRLRSNIDYALYVNNTTIGSDNLNFVSINSSGSSQKPGIYLNNTGSSGALKVTGQNSSPGSGGVIANKTGWGSHPAIPQYGVGIYLNNTLNPQLAYMDLNYFSNYAIAGSNVNGLTLTNIRITGTSGDQADSFEGAIYLNNLSGSATIHNSQVSGGRTDNIRVLNSTGSLDRLTISNSTIGSNHSQDGQNGLLFEASGTATMNLTVTGSTFQGAGADLLQTNALDNSHMDIVLTGNTFHNTQAGSSGGGVIISGGGSGSAPEVTYRSRTTPSRAPSTMPWLFLIPAPTAILTGASRTTPSD